jgi:hypothetical protein
MVQWAVEVGGMCAGSCNNSVSLTINWTDARGKPQSFSVGPIPLNKDNAEVAGTHCGALPIRKSDVGFGFDWQEKILGKVEDRQ